MPSCETTSQPTRLQAALVLFVICVVALWLRAPFIGAGMPFFYDEDEGHHFNRTVEMVKTGDWNPHYFLKPSLHFYLRAPVVAAAFLWSRAHSQVNSLDEIRTRDRFGLGKYSFTASHPPIAKATRALSVLLSVLIVALTFLVACEVGASRSAGLGAAFLVAISPDLVSSSAVIGVDVVMSFFCILTTWLALRTLRSFSLLSLAITGLCAGLAVSSKYNVLPVAVLPLAICLARRDFRPKALAIASIVPALGFFAASPFILISFPLFYKHITYEIWHYAVAGQEGHMGTPGLPQVMFYYSWLWESALGAGAAILMVLGLLILLIKHSYARTIFLLFPLLYFGLMVQQRVNFTRNMFVIVPYAAILAVITASFALSWIRTRIGCSIAATVLFAGIFIAPLHHSVMRRAEASSTGDSRLAAIDFISRHRAALGELALGGKLLMPQSLRELPGVSVVDQATLTIRDAYLDGFDSILLGPPGIKDEDRPWINSLQNFPGQNEIVRVPRNPRMDLVHIDDAAARSKIMNSGEWNESTTRNFSFTGTPLSAPCTGPAELLDTSESLSYCWLSKRLTLLRFDSLEALRHAGGSSREVTLRVRSPWQNQKLTLAAGGWSETIAFSAAEQGQWTSKTFTVPDTAIAAQGGIIAMLSDVHSPANLGLSADTRRLGIALERIQISSK